MVYVLLANLVVAVHVLVVVFIVFGELAVLAGYVFRWQWICNPWFRWSHLFAIVVVASEQLAGIACPLTLWENELRRLGGASVSGEEFIGRCLHSLIFYDFPPWVFTSVYTLFAMLVAATFFLAPPRRLDLSSLVTATEPKTVEAAD